MPDQFLLVTGLSLLVILVLISAPLRRLRSGVVLVIGALLIGLIALVVFFGPAGWAPGLLCGGGVVAGGAALYGVLALMERWAQSDND